MIIWWDEDGGSLKVWRQEGMTVMGHSVLFNPSGVGKKSEGKELGEIVSHC